VYGLVLRIFIGIWVLLGVWNDVLLLICRLLIVDLSGDFLL